MAYPEELRQPVGVPDVVLAFRRPGLSIGHRQLHKRQKTCFREDQRPDSLNRPSAQSEPAFDHLIRVSGQYQIQRLTFPCRQRLQSMPEILSILLLFPEFAVVRDGVVNGTDQFVIVIGFL